MCLREHSYLKRGIRRMTCKGEDDAKPLPRFFRVAGPAWSSKVSPF